MTHQVRRQMVMAHRAQWVRAVTCSGTAAVMTEAIGDRKTGGVAKVAALDEAEQWVCAAQECGSGDSDWADC